MRRQLRAVVMVVAPVVLLAAFIYHPYVGNVTDLDSISDAVTDDPDRWAWSHLTLIVGTGLMIVALMSVRHELRMHGDERWSFVALPLAIFGAALIAGAVGLDVMLGPVTSSGVDVGAVLDAAEPWATGIYLVGALALSLGLIGTAIGTWVTKPLGGNLDMIATAGFVVVAVANFVPFSVAEYVVGLASIVAIWPYAYRAWATESMGAAPTQASASA